MRVIIVEDEPIMQMSLRKLLESIPEVKVDAVFSNAQEPLVYVQQHPIDLVFIDICIAEDSGLELASMLRDMSSNMDIVFVTSHSHFALDAFEAYPLDYMVKPITKQRLTQTVERALARRSEAATSLADDNIQYDLYVHTLGSLEVASTKSDPIKWISKKSQELFFYLLIHRGRSVAKSRIIENIFSDMSIKNAESYLNTAIYQLRKALDQHGLKSIVQSSQEQYHLSLQRVDVDFIRLESGVARIQEISEENIDEAISLEKLYQGRLFEDKAYDWSYAEQELLAIRYAGFAKNLAQWLIAAERYTEALQIGHRLIEQNELDEEANYILIQCHGHLKDIIALENQFNQYKRLMKEELGMPVSSMIKTAYESFKL